MSIQTTAKRTEVTTRGTFPIPTPTQQRKLADCTIVIFNQDGGRVEDAWAEQVFRSLEPHTKKVREISCNVTHEFTQELQARAIEGIKDADVAVIMFYRRHATKVEELVGKLRTQMPKIKVMLLTADPEGPTTGVFDLVVEKAYFTKENFRDEVRKLVETD